MNKSILPISVLFLFCLGYSFTPKHEEGKTAFAKSSLVTSNRHDNQCKFFAMMLKETGVPMATDV